MQQPSLYPRGLLGGGMALICHAWREKCWPMWQISFLANGWAKSQ